jgi:hypothetical protein
VFLLIFQPNVEESNAHSCVFAMVKVKVSTDQGKIGPKIGMLPNGMEVVDTWVEACARKRARIRGSACQPGRTAPTLGCAEPIGS